ncbi:MAG TPA: DNA mismatch repair protein MutS, partial [Thermoanaerobaculia bacterium]|nr:DNA mismatch repair protein MutS [Thermoanaerobaculia bacterium]
MRATPMLEQYWALKREAGDALLLYRLGDFYEMFFEDAAYAAPLLGLVLTARHKDSDVEAPMCGIPQHALEPYLAKLVAAGKKVAISEQTEAPAKGRTLVARKIVRIVTPGTIVDPERLDAGRPNEMAAVTWNGDCAAVSTLDLSTGDFAVVKLPDRAALTEWLLRRVPRELVVFPSDRTAAESLASSLAASGAEPPSLTALRDESPRGAGAVDLLKRHFRTATLEPFGLTGAGAAADAAAALLSYARATQRADCDHVRSLRSEAPDDGLVVDAVTASHLELFRSARDGGPKGTLFSLLDRTGTSFGARALRRLLERPLGRRAGIEARLDGVEELQEDAARLESLASAFREIPDLPRLLGRLAAVAERRKV